MTLLIAYIIVFIIYFACPKAIRLAIFLINLFIPDPLPFIDEIIMFLGLFANRLKF